ncbi:MAG TPA: class I SAM-dependent methyltransferase [Chryseosolibacter sp.]
MEKKDFFSKQSAAYAAFRPTYPEELYRFIFKHLKDTSCAWDCATGNGQVARYLAKHFHKVYATDISRQQLNNAFRAHNILYSLSAAEKTIFERSQFDLITVGQALHWFDLDAFYKEVQRTGKPGGLLAAWGYDLPTIEPVIDALLLDFYHNKMGPYWDHARKLVENQYRNIPFPFKEILCPDLYIKINWTADQFTGYLSSWSATQKFILANGDDPLDSFRKKLLAVWKPEEVKIATFPVFMRLGRISLF